MRGIRYFPFLISLLPITSGAVEIKTGTIEQDHRIQVLSATEEETTLKFEVGMFRLNPISIDGQSYSMIDWEGGVLPLDKGNPALPGFRESLRIPDDAEMAIEVVASEHRDYPGIRIAPSKGTFTRDIDPDTVPWEFSDVYRRDAWYPTQMASLGDPYILRDERGVVVAVDPFQWNAATQTLRVYTSITVHVKSVGQNGSNALVSRPEDRVSEFEKIYARHFLNYGHLSRYTTVSEVGSMLVVAHDAFIPAVQPLADWKNQMGVPTTIVPMSTIGTTGTQLKAYVQNVYNTEGVCFILLVGDAAQVPYLLNGGAAADPMLTLLAGADSYPDAFVGRISAENIAQVETQVGRLVEYERDPNPDGLWYGRGVAIASNEGEGYGDEGQADWQHAQIYRAQLLGFTYSMINEMYDGTHPSEGGLGGGGQLDMPGNPTAAMLSPFINSGRGFIHYTGHGSTYSWATTGFNTTNINALTNQNMLPYVVSVGCVNGEFMFTTCFAETWMRATSGGEPTGAIGCYASTVNQQWATPMEAQDEMINVLTDGTKFTFGGTCFNGSCSMIEHYGNNGITEFKNWTLFGDPSLQMRTATPTALAVSHAGVVDASAGVFQVQTEPEALVAISDQFVLLGSAFADENGLAVVSFDSQDLLPLASVTLTVTGFNFIPHVAPVDVITGSTAVSANSSPIHIGQNHPNPFDRSTGISLALDRDDHVRLDIFDVSGRKVRSLHEGMLPAGTHQIVWDGTTDDGVAATAGTYFYRVTAANGTETRRMVRVR